MIREKWMSDEGYASGVKACRKMGGDTLAMKRGQLFELEVAVGNLKRGLPSPRMVAAMIGFVFGGAIVGGALLYLKVLDTFLSGAVVGLISGLISGWVIVGYSGFPASHFDYIDSLLAQYEPVLVQAYVDLQKKVREAGGFEPLVLEDWLKLESKAIDVVELERKVLVGGEHPGGSKFLSKKIGQ